VILSHKYAIFVASLSNIAPNTKSQSMGVLSVLKLSAAEIISGIYWKDN
jgi:hypothetical protein